MEIKWNGIMKVSQKEIYNYLEDEGFSPDNYRVVKDALSSIEYESFKLNDFNIIS